MGKTLWLILVLIIIGGVGTTLLMNNNTITGLFAMSTGLSDSFELSVKGTAYKTEYVEGKEGYGIKVDNIANLEYPIKYFNKEKGSVEIWFKVFEIESLNNRFLFHINEDNKKNDLRIYIPNSRIEDQNLRFAIYDENQKFKEIRAPIDWEIDTWYHMKADWNNGDMTMIVDDITYDRIVDMGGTGIITKITKEKFNVGSSVYKGSQLNGVIDELKVS